MELDKKLHLLVGALIGVIVSLVFILTQGDILKGMGIALAGAAIAGVLKEVYDFFDYGKADGTDFAWTAAGGAFGALVSGGAFALL